MPTTSSGFVVMTLTHDFSGVRDTSVVIASGGKVLHAQHIPALVPLDILKQVCRELWNRYECNSLKGYSPYT